MRIAEYCIDTRLYSSWVGWVGMEKGRCLISTISFRHYRPLSMPHKKVHAIAVDRHPTFEVEIRSTAKSQHVPWPNSCVLLHPPSSIGGLLHPPSSISGLLHPPSSISAILQIFYAVRSRAISIATIMQPISILLHMLYLDPAYVLSLLLLAGKIVAVGGVGVVCFGFEAFRFVT